MSNLFDLFMGLGQVAIGRAQVKANNMLSEVNAEASNKVRTARNAAEAASNNLKRWMQSVNNNRVLESGGSALEANTVNFRRTMDDAMFQDFSTQVRSAEQRGAAMAMQGASGIGGSVVDMVNGATALRDALIGQRADDVRKMQGFDAAQRASQIMKHTIGSLDSSIILDTFDTNRDVSQRQVAPRYGPVVLNYALGVAEDAMKLMAGMPPSGENKAKKAADMQSWDASSASKFSFKLDTPSMSIGTSESFRSW